MTQSEINKLFDDIPKVISNDLMKLISLVPHPTYILNEQNEVIYTIPPSGQEARAKTKSERIDNIVPDDAPKVFIPCVRTTFGEISGVPEYQCGVIYIVSTIVASALPDRLDLFVPQEVQRDANGVIIGARKLGRVA